MRNHLQAGVGAGLNLEDSRAQSGWGVAHVLEVRISGFWTCFQSDIRGQTFHIPPHDLKALFLMPHDSNSAQDNTWCSPDCLHTRAWCPCCGIRLQLLEDGWLQTLPFCTLLEATLCSGRQALRDEKQVLTPNVCVFSGCLAGIL